MNCQVFVGVEQGSIRAGWNYGPHYGKSEFVLSFNLSAPAHCQSLTHQTGDRTHASCVFDDGECENGRCDPRCEDAFGTETESGRAIIFGPEATLFRRQVAMRKLSGLTFDIRKRRIDASISWNWC